VRCKDNLGIFNDPNPAVRYEFINIREHCAWIHQDDPRAATDKAVTLVGAAVAVARVKADRSAVSTPFERSAVILGSGPAAQHCLSTLVNLGIQAERCEDFPDQIRRTGGQYQVTQGDQAWKASTLVLAPNNMDKIPAALAGANQEGDRPFRGISWDVNDTRRSGIITCHPDLDPAITGAAAATRVNAWLEQAKRRNARPGATVDMTRCRACSTCVDLCEYNAPEIIRTGQVRTAWIDPSLCESCGTCAAHCPSGAISTDPLSEAQLAATLEVLLA
jgi:heterodisulfide reductase subunit A-like polyferredoxin